ncbi:MASE1 domain-containing protein [Sphingomonas lycopersici]|uniref:histidine kinase n=1 Tax=Sphingomonas lycopersici TaxID=2951807 RepID=A0AA41ZBR8_9SPHN|nr:MASE1 domain-containing protein [Sphingomonas lycopersici]MCW6533711.1 MASE1 domain-containing protein [Sphingomonas lycopersici]
MRTPIAALATAVIFGLLSWASITLTRDEGRIAALWLPNAFLVGIVLRDDAARIGWFLLPSLAANVAANLIAGDALLPAVMLSLCNSLEIIIVCAGLRRAAGPHPDLSQLRPLAWLALFGGFVAPAASGFFAMATLAPHDLMTAGTDWVSWVISDGLGLLIVTPIVSILADGLHRSPRLDKRSAIEWAVILAAGSLLTVVIFRQDRFPFPFLAMPFVIVAAFRLGTLGAAIATTVIAIVASVATSTGHGPLYTVQGGTSSRIFVLQVFLLVTFASSLPVAAALASLQRLQKQFREERDFRDSILDNMLEVAFRTDAQGCWTFLNPAWVTITGYSVAESLGTPTTRLLHPDDYRKTQEVYPQIAAGELAECLLEQRFIRADGEVRHIEVSVRALRDEDGGFIGTSGNIRDVSGRKAIEAQRDEALRRAEMAAAAKASFLANMSHEIRTPMNGVIGFTDLLLQSHLDDEQRRYTQLIAESGRTMMRLLNDILDLSKIDAGQMTVVYEPYDLAHALRSSVRLMSVAVERKGLTLDLDIDKAIPSHVIGDSLRVRQILANLIGNAVKFTETGGIRVSARVAEDAETLMIAVSDTGIGIAPERQKAIFDEFVQEDDTTARRFGGTGLGLAISRRLAGLMGGGLTLDSTPGIGTTMTVSLPLIRSDAAPAPRNDPPSISATDSGRGRRILLAEDHDVNQLLAIAMLKRLGCAVDLATDGAEAIERVRAAGDSGYDLVFMDVQMPGVDGLEATRRLRAAGFGADRLPIVALTANAYEDDIAACFSAGMQGHVAKPLQIADLQAALERFVPAAHAPTAAPTADPVVERLRERYNAFRSIAAAAFEAAVANIDLTQSERGALQTTAHKLAGNAGVFGEGDIGAAARAIDDAIANGAAVPEIRARLAACLDLIRAG